MVREHGVPGLINMESTTNTDMGVDAAAMEAMYDETLKNFNEGSIVTGKVLSVHDGDVLIDIGYKSEGIVSVQEFNDLEEDPVGQEVEVFLAVNTN